MKTKKMNTSVIKTVSLIVTAMLSFGTAQLYAAKYMGKDNTGARYFHCGYTCGKFKVIRTGKNTYRVISILFGGEIKANSYKEAARKACEAGGDPREKESNPLPSRGEPSC